MKILAAILIAPLLLLLAGTGVAAEPPSPFEQRCERDMKPRIEVSSRQDGYNVSNTISSRRLNNQNAHNGASELMLGMTSRQVRSEIVFNSPVLVDPASGRECIAPRVSVELSYPPMEIFVAREFHPDSCPYREILAHEMLHVGLYRDKLPRIAQLVRAELAARYAGRPLYARAGDGLDALQRDIDSWLRPLIKEQLETVEGLQADIDNAEETGRLSHACTGELATRLGSSF